MSGSADGLNPPEESFTAERLALAETLSAPLQGEEPFERLVQMVLDGMIPELGDTALAVVPGEGGDYDIIASSRSAEHAGQVRHRVRELLPLLTKLARAEAARGRTFQWVPSMRRSALRLQARQGPDLFPHLEALGIHSLIIVGLRASGQWYGALAVARTQPEQPYHAIDLAVAQVVARRIALTFDAARLRSGSLSPGERRKHLEQALRRWVRVFYRSSWGAAVVDSSDHRIDAVNPAFARLHGFAEPGQLTGRLYSDLLAPEHHGELLGWPGAGGAGPPQETYESEHRREDGSTFPVLVNVTSLEDSSPASYVVTVQDLSSLKRTEERLHRAQRMEVVGRLAGGVAHEVNNMMTIILGFGDLLARASDLPGDRRREVEEILKAAVRAGKITTQLLAFSRQQVLHPADLRLADVVEDMGPVLRLMLPANIRVETRGGPGSSVVHADRTQLEQVLINLTFNARDAMPGGGVIRVTTDSRRLAEADGLRRIGIPIPEGRYGLVCVADTGYGMDADTVNRVFEPFFTTKEVGQGTGLGLSTVYGIVKQSGGYVWVESTLDQGTTFTVCLPEVEAPAEVAPPRPSEPRLTAAGRTVLVIEDEDGVRELAARILTDRTHRVLVARSGGEALSELDREPGNVDLVLTDVIVPDIGTDQLAQEVRQRYPRVPILYMSGYPREEIVQRGLLDREQPFLQKPFTAQQLTRAVDEVLGAGEAGGERITPALSSG